MMSKSYEKRYWLMKNDSATLISLKKNDLAHARARPRNFDRCGPALDPSVVSEEFVGVTAAVHLEGAKTGRPIRGYQGDLPENRGRGLSGSRSDRRRRHER
ncbi:hypothetical protein NKI56_21735 [Mesorhizobium sp. M0622]|uniref:hypothetical protein n=1 Tax=unclassified Mesorhizobium TaxID=325217 RepID=UPI00333848DB